MKSPSKKLIAKSVEKYTDLLRDEYIDSNLKINIEDAEGDYIEGIKEGIRLMKLSNEKTSKKIKK